MNIDLSILAQRKIGLNSLKNCNNEDLCVLYQNGMREALTELTIKNTKLIYSRAYRYIKKTGNKLEIDDLVQWGFIGMLKAAGKFDYNLGNKFTTYAVWWIDQSISRAIIDEGYTIRLPVHIYEKVEKVHSIIRLNESVNTDKIIETIVKELNLEKDTVLNLLKLYTYILNVNSLYTPIGENGDKFLMDFISYSKSNKVEEEIEKTILSEEIKELLETLNPREQEVLEMRYGLNGYEPHTLEEIGDKFKLTRERIRQIQEKALKKLRHPTCGRRLREFLYED